MNKKNNYSSKKNITSDTRFYKEKTKYVKKNNVKAVAKTEDEGIRLNKYISNSGVCSRREADIYITSGNVRVNDQLITELGYKVKPSDKVTFDGIVLNPEKKVYVLLNKPKNFSTTSTTNNVQNLINGASKSKLTPVGKMDATTTGLLLLTNDNDLITKFTQESQRSSKIYQVSLDKNLKYEDLEKIQKGITIDQKRVLVEEISYIETLPKTEIGIQIRTSNIKVVRKIFETLDYDVLKIDRVTFAGLTKKNLPRGMWRYLTPQEVINIKNI
ncbi:MAG: S4 domain-containing protein [Bacteroidota bacterium]|nr:S4 domain-containing protein [Bacteroidota bacterium]